MQAAKICAAVIGLVLATATASIGNGREPAVTKGNAYSEPDTGAPPASPLECCKVCTKGKACGNSCIAQDKQCHQPPGCACDG